jgi:predicted esterase
MPGAERWTRVAVQALHRVYRGRTPEVVASWMTSQDRDEMIADNIAYVEAVVRAIAPRAGVAVVHAGFSQGAAMAFRAAVHGGAAGIISVGGDVPPDVLAGRDVIPPVFLARGDKDDWYSGAQHERDAEALRARGVSVEPFVYAGGHAWTADVSVAAAAWLESIAAAP